MALVESRRVVNLPVILLALHCGSSASIRIVQNCLSAGRLEVFLSRGTTALRLRFRRLYFPTHDVLGVSLAVTRLPAFGRTLHIRGWSFTLVQTPWCSDGAPCKRSRPFAFT